MKRVIVMFSLLAAALTAAAQQKADQVQTHTSVVLSNWSTKSVKSLTIPSGPTANFPSYVADTSKCGALYFQTSDSSLYVYVCALHAWKNIMPKVSFAESKAYADSLKTQILQHNNSYTGNNQVTDAEWTFNPDADIRFPLANLGTTVIRRDPDGHGVMIYRAGETGYADGQFDIRGDSAVRTSDGAHVLFSGDALAGNQTVNGSVTINTTSGGAHSMTINGNAITTNDGTPYDIQFAGGGIDYDAAAHDFFNTGKTVDFLHLGDGSTSAVSYAPNLQVGKAATLHNDIVNKGYLDSLYVQATAVAAKQDVSVADTAALTAYTGAMSYMRVRDTTTGGAFVLIDTTGTHLKKDGIRAMTSHTSGKLWVRVTGHDIDIRMIGAKAAYFDTTGVREYDNTAKINACVLAMRDVGGGRVHIPPGYFGVTGIALADKVILYGDDYPNSVFMKMPGADTNAMIRMTTYGEGYGINGLRMIGNPANATGVFNGIWFNQKSATAPPGGFKYGSFGLGMPQLENIIMQDIPGIGMKLNGVTGLMGTRIRLQRIGQQGLYMIASTDNRFNILTVQQACHLGGNYSGIYVDGTSANNEFSNIKVGSGGLASDTANNGMYIQGNRNMVVNANFQSNHGAGLRIGGTLANSNNISNIVSDSNLNYGVVIDNTGGGAYGNTIDGATVFAATTTKSTYHTKYGFWFINNPQYTQVIGEAHGDSLKDIAGTLGTHSRMNIVTQDTTGLTNIQASFTPSLTGGTVALSSTVYFAPAGISTSSATEGQRQVIAPATGYLANLYVTTSSTQSATGSMVVTIRKAGSNTALVATIPLSATAAQFSDITDFVAVNKGDLLSIQVQNNATATSASIKGITFNIVN